MTVKNVAFLQGINKSCAEYIDSYWQGKEKRSTTNRHLYNICPKLYKAVLTAYVTGQLFDSQDKYSKTIVSKIGRATSFDDGRILKKVLGKHKDDYIPIYIVFAVFVVCEKTYMTVINNNSKYKDEIQTILNEWFDRKLIIRRKSKGENYVSYKRTYVKLLKLFNYILSPHEVDKWIKRLNYESGKDIFLSILKKLKRKETVSLTECIIAGVMLRWFTRFYKLHNFLNPGKVKLYANSITQSVDLSNLLLLLSESDIVKEYVEYRDIMFKRIK